MAANTSPLIVSPSMQCMYITNLQNRQHTLRVPERTFQAPRFARTRPESLLNTAYDLDNSARNPTLHHRQPACPHHQRPPLRRTLRPHYLPEFILPPLPQRWRKFPRRQQRFCRPLFRGTRQFRNQTSWATGCYVLLSHIDYSCVIDAKVIDNGMVGTSLVWFA
jgi:hypothetical protein